jgi:hypothetical protein
MQESGKMLQAKKIRFHSSDRSELETKNSALHRQEKRNKITYLLRSGKMKEEELYARRKHRRR